ncbi:tetratricopeptide repeat protein [Bacillus sp. FJAT-47783]|uniref:tetratricopeptide repeat protein n=1 Tax=Bacillus sp. FJAT-47783 TaxID=2922712 RepID=UPI001FACA0BE
MTNQVNNRHEQSKVVLLLQDSRYFYRRGLKAYREHNLSLAAKMFHRAMNLSPKDENVLVQLAMIYTELQEYEKSNELLQRIIKEVNPHMTECYYFMANNYAHLGLFHEAHKYALLYEEQNEDGEFDEEINDLLDMLAIEVDDDLFKDQDDLIVKQEIAKSYLENGQFHKAIEQLCDLIEEYPEFWSAYNNLALAHFYLGEVKEAKNYLSLVLERNPGNLHALCNLLVFYFYERKDDDVRQLVKKLACIHPMLTEHRYKLGATFALVGYYDEAFKWLYSLYRSGFNGDDTFFYWLSYSAYYTGHHELSYKCWEKVLEYNPDKEGSEPWAKSDSSYELEIELYNIYMISKHSDRKEELLNRQFHTPLEKEAIEYVLSNGKNEKTVVSFAFRVADMLKREDDESFLLIEWFHIFIQAVKHNIKLQNEKAWAAAVHYVHLKHKKVQVTKTNMADMYQLSPATLTKYVRQVEKFETDDQM